MCQQFINEVVVVFGAQWVDVVVMSRGQHPAPRDREAIVVELQQSKTKKLDAFKMYQSPNNLDHVSLISCSQPFDCPLYSFQGLLKPLYPLKG